jgi:hypothetical protein
MKKPSTKRLVAAQPHREVAGTALTAVAGGSPTLPLPPPSLS